MAENIVDISKWKEANSPHCSGNAVCLHCKYEWVAVVPTGITYFECPECKLEKGVYVGLFYDKQPHYTCNCGNQLFAVTPTYIYCIFCGQESSYTQI